MRREIKQIAKLAMQKIYCVYIKVYDNIDLKYEEHD